MKLYVYWFKFNCTYIIKEKEVQYFSTFNNEAVYFYVQGINYSIEHLNNLDLPFYSPYKLSKRQVYKLSKEIYNYIF